MTPPPGDYGAIAKTLHWLIAGLAVALLALGLTMTRASDLQLKFSLYQLHKSLGVTVLLLMVARLAWRTWVRPPALPPDARLGARGGGSSASGALRAAFRAAIDGMGAGFGVGVQNSHPSSMGWCRGRISPRWRNSLRMRKKQLNRR